MIIVIIVLLIVAIISFFAIRHFRIRRFLDYIDKVESSIKKRPDDGLRYNCPCCYYPTLKERGGYDICSLCSWEDDGQDDPHADEDWGGPNHGYSLSEARKNFKDYLVMYLPDNDPRLGQGDSERTKLAKTKIIEFFKKIKIEENKIRKNELREMVRANEKILYDELVKSYREYQNNMKNSDLEN